MDMKLTYLGGSTFLLEVGSFRFLTDPGFDPYGTEKSEGPGHEVVAAMHDRGRIEGIGKSIHAHPTLSEMVKATARAAK